MAMDVYTISLSFGHVDRARYGHFYTVHHQKNVESNPHHKIYNQSNHFNIHLLDHDHNIELRCLSVDRVVWGTCDDVIPPGIAESLPIKLVQSLFTTYAFSLVDLSIERL